LGVAGIMAKKFPDVGSTYDQATFETVTGVLLFKPTNNTEDISSISMSVKCSFPV